MATNDNKPKKEKASKAPRVTRKAQKVAKMYADNPTWAKEDAPGAYKKGGATKMKTGGMVNPNKIAKVNPKKK